MHIVYVYCVRFSAQISTANNSKQRQQQQITHTLFSIIQIMMVTWSQARVPVLLVLWHVHCAHLNTFECSSLKHNTHAKYPDTCMLFIHLSRFIEQMILIHVDNLFQSTFAWRHIFRLLAKTFTTFSRDLRKTENVTRRLGWIICFRMLEHFLIGFIFISKSMKNYVYFGMHAACEMKKES